MLIQEWRRIRIHAAMPIAMFVAMTMASTSARAGSPGQIRVHSRPSSIMPTSIAATISRQCRTERQLILRPVLGWLVTVWPGRSEVRMQK